MRWRARMACRHGLTGGGGNAAAVAELLRSRPSAHPRARLGLLVDPDEAQVVVGDLVGRGLALEVAVEEALQGVPPDRATDREAHEALDRCRLLEPVVDLLVAGAPAEQDADDAVAAVAAGRLGQRLGARALLDALDLPDVRLDALVLQVDDRPAHEVGPQLGVV